MKIGCIALILVGVGWIFTVLLLYVLMAGIATPISLLAVFWYFLTRAVGGLLLIVGPSLILSYASPKFGAVLVLIAVGMLTSWTGLHLLLLRHVEPLQAKPSYIDYALFGSVFVVALLSDFIAVGLCRVIFRGD